VSILFGLVGGGSKIMGLILQIVGVGGYAGEKINLYLNETAENSLTTNNNPLLIFILGLIKRCIFIPVFFYIENRIKFDHSRIQGYLNLYMIGNIMYFLFAKDLTIFVRASVPFLFFEIFLVAYTLYYFKSSRSKFIVIFMLVMLIAGSRFNALINSYYKLYVPYNSIFDDRINRVTE